MMCLNFFNRFIFCMVKIICLYFLIKGDYVIKYGFCLSIKKLYYNFFNLKY